MSLLPSILKTAVTVGCLMTCLAACGGERAAEKTATPTPTVTPTLTPTVTPTCVQAGEHCLTDVSCCEGLDCCAGVPIPPGEEFCADNCPVSDRRVKTSIEPVNPREVLERVASLPISTWSYISDPSGVRHMGPMAQDFHASFGLGASNLCIPTVDASGVALASIQALNERVETVRQENEKLKDENARLQARLDRLETLLLSGAARRQDIEIP